MKIIIVLSSLFVGIIIFAISSIYLNNNSLVVGIDSESTPISTIYRNDEVKNDVSEQTQDILYSEKRLLLKGQNHNEVILVKSYPVELFSGQTDIIVGQDTSHPLSLKGFLYNIYLLDIDDDNNDEIEIETLSGQSINSTIYKYENGQLKRIPVSTEIVGSYIGVVTRNFPEFSDLDGDGTLEMLSYYRHFPPENSRTVNVYDFDGLIYRKINEYEEATDQKYL